MKITLLRLYKHGCHALGNADAFTSSDKCQISAIGGGDYLIKTPAKTVRIPAHRVDFAVCEDDGKEAKTAK